MKYRIPALLLALFFLFSMTGCGDTASVSPSSSETEPQTFGNTFSDMPSGGAETTAPPSDESSAEADPAAAAARTVHDSVAISAILVCDAVERLPYSADDPMYFWRAIGYLAGLLNADQETVSMTAADVEIYAGALFPLAFASSSDWPALTEEDPLVSRDSANYLVHLPDISDLTFDVRDAVPAGDSAYTAHAEIFRDGESLGQYTVHLTDYSGPNSGHSIFDHSILGLDPLLT